MFFYLLFVVAMYAASCDKHSSIDTSLSVC